MSQCHSNRMFWRASILVQRFQNITLCKQNNISNFENAVNSIPPKLQSHFSDVFFCHRVSYLKGINNSNCTCTGSLRCVHAYLRCLHIKRSESKYGVPHSTRGQQSTQIMLIVMFPMNNKIPYALVKQPTTKSH